MHLAEGYEAICIFVNDDASRNIIEALAKDLDSACKEYFNEENI